MPSGAVLGKKCSVEREGRRESETVVVVCTHTVTQFTQTRSQLSTTETGRHICLALLEILRNRIKRGFSGERNVFSWTLKKTMQIFMTFYTDFTWHHESQTEVEDARARPETT